MADTNEVVNPMQDDYIKTIEELKLNTVAKDEYNKMLEENRRLLSTIVNGEQSKVDVPEENVDITECRKALFDGNTSNIKFAENALKLRDELIRQGGREADPFVPHGSQIVATDEDYTEAQKVAEGLQHCLEFADGDSSVFTNELQRITRDVRGYR